MSSANNLFGKIASDILSKSTSNENNQRTGTSLYDCFCSFLFERHENLTPVQKKQVVAFYKGAKNVFSIQVQTTAIKVVINAKFGTLKDAKKLFRDVSNVGHWGNGDYQIRLEDDEYFDYVISLIKQNY
jgi:predicted transport protein